MDVHFLRRRKVRTSFGVPSEANGPSPESNRNSVSDVGPRRHETRVPKVWEGTQSSSSRSQERTRISHVHTRTPRKSLGLGR